MSLSMYSASVPLLVRTLKNLQSILRKGSEYATEKNVKGEVLTTARLFPDMFPLNRQVHIACDIAKACGARLAGVEVPSFEDTEVTFDELHARIEKTIAFLDSLDSAAIDGSATKRIQLKTRAKEFDFTGAQYLLEWVLPNVYFHVTTAYDILRHNGVPLGKADFLG